MFSARCRSEGLTCLPGGCSTPSGRGSGGGLLPFDGEGCEDPVGLLVELPAAAELEVEASLLLLVLLKNADECEGPARFTAAWRT